MERKDWISWIVAVAFAIQSLVVSSAMITKALTVPFLASVITVSAGWITLVLIVLALILLIIHALTG